MTVERRICTLLAGISPLTRGQILRALTDVPGPTVSTTLHKAHLAHKIRRVSCSAAQRHLTGGTGGAYQLGDRQ